MRSHLRGAIWPGMDGLLTAMLRQRAIALGGNAAFRFETGRWNGQETSCLDLIRASRKLQTREALPLDCRSRPGNDGKSRLLRRKNMAGRSNAIVLGRSAFRLLEGVAPKSNPPGVHSAKRGLCPRRGVFRHQI